MVVRKIRYLDPGFSGHHLALLSRLGIIHGIARSKLGFKGLNLLAHDIILC
jgi:hypothetical protein